MRNARDETEEEKLGFLSPYQPSVCDLKKTERETTPTRKREEGRLPHKAPSFAKADGPPKIAKIHLSALHDGVSKKESWSVVEAGGRGNKPGCFTEPARTPTTHISIAERTSPPPNFAEKSTALRRA